MASKSELRDPGVGPELVAAVRDDVLQARCGTQPGEGACTAQRVQPRVKTTKPAMKSQSNPSSKEAGSEGAEQDEAVYHRAERVCHVAVAEVEQVLEEEAGGERS